MTDPDLRVLADEPALTGLEHELLHALEVTNAILEMIQENLRRKRIDVSYPQLSRMFDAQIPKNAAPIVKARAQKYKTIREYMYTP